MASRLNLHEVLCEVLGTEEVYFNPPESKKMSYPCIRYELSDPDLKYANDRNYSKTSKYEGVVIDWDPESTIPDSVLSRFPMCRLGKPYRADNLNHFPFTLYF